MNSELKIRLDRIVNDLAKTEGIDGSLIVDGNGEVLSHHLLHDVDVELFGPMANVITGSSKRLTNFSNQGEIERILVESEKGKALFLHLGNVHFIVLMKNKANVGMIMISSKRASEEITDLTKDLTPIQLEEQIAKEEVTEPTVKAGTKEEAPKTFIEAPVEVTVEKTIPQVDEESLEPVKNIQPIVEETKPEPEEIEAKITEPVKEEIPTPIEEEITKPKEAMETTATETTEQALQTATGTISEVSQTAADSETDLTSETVSTTETVPDVEPKEEISDSSEVIEEEKQKSGAIPVIRPPITFPKLKKITEIPEDQSERVDLLLKIYESIFLAMSIGASKIMGVAPARGLTRKFLPVEDCKTLLDGVDVKNNSAIDFMKIKENADKIPLSDREKIFNESFGKIIAIITENYGKVMGYDAFRAMIRPEFKIINESCGHLLIELGVKEQLHPELQNFFN